jgi:hypothetical protein
LQLNQLPAAERSPVGRAVEHEGDLALLEQVIERALFAFLILECKFRRLFADLQASLIVGRGFPLALGLGVRGAEQDDGRRECNRLDPE